MSNERTVEFIANPGGQIDFCSDFKTPEVGLGGGMGSGKTRALAFVGVAAACVNKGPWMWTAETAQQFSDNNIPPLQEQADMLDLGMEVKQVSSGKMLIFEGLRMRDEWAAKHRNTTGGNVCALVRFAVAGKRVAGSNVTHGCADELARYEMYLEDTERDAWTNLGFRVRLEPSEPDPEFLPIIRAAGTHEGKGTHLYKDFFGKGPNAILDCPKCKERGHMRVLPGHTPAEQEAGTTRWLQWCGACDYHFVSSRGYTASAYDNPHLKPGYMNRVIARISPALIKPYLLGICVDIGSGKTAWSFTANNLAPVRYTRGQPIYLCCDFNVSPMAWTLWQPCNGCEIHSDRGSKAGGWHAIAEFMHPVKAATEDMIADVIQWLRKHGHEWPVVVYGDTSGDNDDTRSKTTDYEIIYEALDLAGFNWWSNVPEGNNPPIQNSVTLYNAQLHYTVRNPLTGEVESGGCRILINPEECPQLVQDHEQSVLRNRTSGEGGGWTINKIRYDPHAMDGGRYMIWVEAQGEGGTVELAKPPSGGHNLPEPDRRELSRPLDEEDDEDEFDDFEDEFELDESAFEADYGNPWG